MFYRALLALTVGIFAGISLKTLHQRETTPVQTLPGYREGKDLRNQSILKHDYYGLLVFFFVALLLFDKTRNTGIRLIWSIGMEWLTLISLYCVLLLLLLPLLRRTISSRACGRLWELPIILTGSIVYFEAMRYDWWVRLPKLVIYIPRPILRGFTIVWLIGFTVSISWCVINHFRFKKQLQANAREADGQTLWIWGEELAKIGLEQSTPLYITPDLETPLVVGVRKKALAAYLPDKYYTPQELRLIFRHELRHVFRRDAEIKLAWVVIRSLLWFNPLVWIANQKAAEDLELSCDEFVLAEADETTRRRYAELLLDAAGDSRGFSTCLSAGAKTLRYRLKCVVRPGKRLGGAMILALMVCTVILASGTISFADQRGQLNTFYDLEQYTMIENSFYNQIDASVYSTYHVNGLGYYDEQDDGALIRYLSELEVVAVTKPFDNPREELLGEGGWAGFRLYDPIQDSGQWIHLHRDWLVVYGRRPTETQYFKVVGGLDWDHLNKTLIWM